MSKEANLITKKIEDWGKNKFKPTLKETATRTSQNPFTKPQNFNSTGDKEIGQFNKGGFNGRNDRGGRFSGNKSSRGRGSFGSRGGGGRGGGGSFGGRGRGRGKFNGNRNDRGAGKFQKDKNDRVKFNQIARDAKPDIATPWTKFKDEINHKQREETQAASQANMDTDEAKNVIKLREMNYRRLLMEEKKLETIQWEDFGENQHQEVDNRKIKKSKQHSDAKKLSNIPPFENTESDKKSYKTIKQNVKNKNKNKKTANKQELGTELAINKASVSQQEIFTTNRKTKVGNSGESKEKPENVEEISTNTKKKNKTKKQTQSEIEQQPNTNYTAEHSENKPKGSKIKRKHTEMEIELNTEEAIHDTGERNTKRSKKMHKNKNLSGEEVTAANSDKLNKNGSKKLKPSLLSNDDLNNVDAKDLSFHQKDALRKIITKSLTKGTNLRLCLENRKHQFACKKLKNMK